MIHNQRTTEVDATPQEVWAVLGRFMHIQEFAPRIRTVDALTDGEDGVGSRRRCNFEDGTSLVEEVTEWEDNRSLPRHGGPLRPVITTPAAHGPV